MIIYNSIPVKCTKYLLCAIYSIGENCDLLYFFLFTSLLFLFTRLLFLFLFTYLYILLLFVLFKIKYHIIISLSVWVILVILLSEVGVFEGMGGRMRDWVYL